MIEKSYTDADRRVVLAAIELAHERGEHHKDYLLADHVLDALAEAGRLIPPRAQEDLRLHAREVTKLREAALAALMTPHRTRCRRRRVGSTSPTRTVPESRRSTRGSARSPRVERPGW